MGRCSDKCVVVAGDVVSGNLARANCTLTEYNSTVGAVNVSEVNELAFIAVSYTHLTLPTIYSV